MRHHTPPQRASQGEGGCLTLRGGGRAERRRKSTMGDFIGRMMLQCSEIMSMCNTVGQGASPPSFTDTPPAAEDAAAKENAAPLSAKRKSPESCAPLPAAKRYSSSALDLPRCAGATPIV